MCYGKMEGYICDYLVFIIGQIIHGEASWVWTPLILIGKFYYKICANFGKKRKR